MADVFAELILRTFAFGNDTVFVPLPTISKHVRERGFGHIEYLLRRLSRGDGRRRACAKVLKRVNLTVQAAKAYELVKNFDPNKHYILVDDVWTTGSSMLAAAQKMRSQGAQKVDILVIAKTV